MVNWYRALLRGEFLKRFSSGNVPVIQVPTLFLG
jgi:hypothetical protein